MIIGAYLLYGVIHYCAARAAHDEWGELFPRRFRIGAVTVRACVAVGILIIGILAAVSLRAGNRSYPLHATSMTACGPRIR